MREKIRTHVDGLFADAPATSRTRELKEELIVNLLDRYDDLIAQGVDEENAFHTAVDGIGDVEDLVTALRQQDLFSPVIQDEQRRKSALLVSVAVGLYIISPIFPLILDEYFGLELLGLVVFFFCIASATGLLIYNYMSKPKYNKIDNTLVEEFKEWKHAKNNTRALQSAINSLVWSCALIVFFLLGFLLRAWHVAWVVFLIAVAVNQVIKAVFIYKGEGQ